MIIKNKKPEEKRYYAKMDFGNGNSAFLEVSIDDQYIYFIRDENGVNAWHCGSLLKTDYKILEIKPCIN